MIFRRSRQRERAERFVVGQIISRKMKLLRATPSETLAALHGGSWWYEILGDVRQAVMTAFIELSTFKRDVAAP